MQTCEAKFVCEDKYRQFRGYVFMWQKPTVVRDRATIEACDRDPAFKRVDDGKQEAKTEAVAEQTQASLPTCRFCARQMIRGLFVHEKYCKDNPVKQ